MKKFNISVNGNSYVVEVEEIKGGTTESVIQPQNAQPIQPKQSIPAENNKPVSTPAAQPVSSGNEGVKAPMPGTINEIKISEGQTVKAGQVLIILEAMKMENEIMSPKDGVVKSINTTKGSSVNTGDVLVVIE